mgnify:CR=1 FL=1
MTEPLSDAPVGHRREGPIFNYLPPLRVTMRCTHCEKCCRETEMMLCETDLRRLERAGYRREEFSRMGEDGITRLGNKGGHCFFYDASAKGCREYARRPLGCVLYPVNLSEDGDIVLDELCPEIGSVTEDEFEEKGRRLRSLLDTIASEARRTRGPQ